MPTGPNGEKRPKSAIANAVRVAKIATGEADEQYEKKPLRTIRPRPRRVPAGSA